MNDLSQKIIDWANRGYEISYSIINQIDNGRRRDVESGYMPLHTFTVYVYGQKEEDYIYTVSHDDPIEALLDGVEYCEKIFNTN